jgi:hypothetical protein
MIRSSCLSITSRDIWHSFFGIPRVGFKHSRDVIVIYAKTDCDKERGQLKPH